MRISEKILRALPLTCNDTANTEINVGSPIGAFAAWLVHAIVAHGAACDPRGRAQARGGQPRDGAALGGPMAAPPAALAAHLAGATWTAQWLRRALQLETGSDSIFILLSWTTSSAR